MRRFRQLGSLLVWLSLTVACAAPTPTESARGAANDQSHFDNILVIGKAQDYDARARFERTLVSRLKATGADAKAYYLAVGGNKPIDRETITGLVETDSFDAVLITKVLRRDANPTVVAGSVATKTVRQDDGALHLFQYDYKDLNEPASLNIELSVLLSSELFDTADGNLIWAIEFSISNKEMTSKIVDEAVVDIIRGLRKDRLVGK